MPWGTAHSYPPVTAESRSVPALPGLPGRLNPAATPQLAHQAPLAGLSAPAALPGARPRVQSEANLHRDSLTSKYTLCATLGGSAPHCCPLRALPSGTVEPPAWF